MKHSFAFINAFRVSDHRYINIVSRLYLEPTGAIVPDDNTLSAFADDPIGKKLHDCVGLVCDLKFDWMDALTLTKNFLELIEICLVRCRRFSVEFYNIEKCKTKFIELGNRFRRAQNSHNLLHRMGPRDLGHYVNLAAKQTVFYLSLFQKLLGFFEAGQSYAYSPAGIY